MLLHDSRPPSFLLGVRNGGRTLRNLEIRIEVYQTLFLQDVGKLEVKWKIAEGDADKLLSCSQETFTPYIWTGYPSIAIAEAFHVDSFQTLRAIQGAHA